MSIVSDKIKTAMTEALKAEIQYFINSATPEIKALINLETFNPLHHEHCLLGQTNQQDGNYRERIGYVPYDHGLGRFKNMTPFEIWSAYYWEKGYKGIVLAVLKCMKGMSQDCPDVVFDEIQTVSDNN